jgi:hypothetical protein
MSEDQVRHIVGLEPGNYALYTPGYWHRGRTRRDSSEPFPARWVWQMDRGQLEVFFDDDGRVFCAYWSEPLPPDEPSKEIIKKMLSWAGRE